MTFVKNHKGFVVGGVIIAIIAIFLASFYSNVNTVRNTLIQKEQGLVAQYKSNQNELSTYVLQVREGLGIADAGSDKLNEILAAAISGRYDGKMNPGTGGAMFSAITEAYPDLTSSTAMYSKLQDLVISGRNSYKNSQNLLLDKIRDYETWTQSDFIRSFIVKSVLNAPTDNLKVTVGDNTFRGQDALDKISQIVLSGEAIDAYNTGTMEPLIGGEKK